MDRPESPGQLHAEVGVCDGYQRLPLGVVAVTAKAFHMPPLVGHAVLGMPHVIRVVVAG